ncbi:phosphoethanolamine N-methyltransferase-like isoform X2 [Pecten maximus]|nr:phosphoethanolamine N-methyltransferase-like isoform X2 [Pecten maximus]
MMLNTRSAELCGEDVSEILSYLPEIEGLDVVELGAGIGRFTRYLAQRARHVLAVDFVEKFIEKNKEANGSFENIDYIVDDVMNVQIPPTSAGFVFTNWLFMYFNDTAARRLLERIITWLPDNGHIFLRESCIHGSGDISLNNSTTYYRHPNDYETLFLSVTEPTDDKQAVYGFKVIATRPVETYRKVMKNGNQITWLLQKVRRDVDTP